MDRARYIESKLGPMKQLKAEAYLADPRKLIADFYMPGDHTGPGGTMRGGPNPGKDATTWFAVYRPCSRDSIAKMLGKVGVGKGLNVKGKSSKKNRLSGFVPFCQISKNYHKKDIEEAPKDSRIHVYYRSSGAREEASKKLQRVLSGLKKGAAADPTINELDKYFQRPGPTINTCD